MKVEKLGMRNIKTGISVMICALLGGIIVENPFYSAIGCIISVQDTVKGSLSAGITRVKGTTLGGILGFLIVLLAPGNPILCGLGVMVTIYLCNLLNLNKGIVVACVTFLSIYLGVIDSTPAKYSFYRVLDTSIGVIVGVFVNYIIARPDYLDNIFNDFKEIEILTKEFIEFKILKEGSFSIHKLQKYISKAEGSYVKLIDELNYNRNDINKEKIKETLKLCREIYFHIQSIELLSNKLYLSPENYNQIKKLYEQEDIEWDLDENKSPVFNYHLSKVIEEIKKLHSINN